MNPDSQREDALFQAAAQLTGPARATFLDGACHGNPALRQRLEALLAADAQSEGLFAEAAPAAKATIKLDLPAAPDEAVGQTLGRYKLLERVGEGGCGVVYVAEQTQPVRRRVALKVIKLGMDTKQVVARFEAERQALAMMDHPNIAKVLDGGTTETGRPYFVMELVRGIRITDYCDQANLSTKERLDLFIKVCQAIQHAHQKGIIHRDIKPSNILVTLHDGVPVPKVIDFGIAKATEGRLTDATVYTQLHQFIGTPAYMSPEQAEMSGLDIDTRSDIYSLGVLLYELLAGSTPFDAKELMASGIDAMRKTIREKEPVRPSTRFATLKGEEMTTTAKRRSSDGPKLVNLLKGDLDWIVMKCLEKDRTRRYETANGVAMDLQRHLCNEPVVARPPSAGYRLQKFARRNKLAFAAGSAVAIALCLGVMVSTWQAVRATREQRIADRERGRAETEAKRADANAAAEARQRQTAEQAVERTKQALSKAMEVEADRLAREGGSGKALAHFARALRLDPDNRVAAQRIVSLLNQRDFPLPLPGQPEDVAFDPLKVAYSSDYRRFCRWTNGSGTTVFESRDGRPVGKPFQFNAPVRWADLNQDGTRLVVGLTNRTIYWDCESGRQLAEVNGVVEARSPDDRLILIDGRVREVDSGRELCSVTDRGQRWGAVFSPDATKLAFLTSGNTQTRSGVSLDRDATVALVLNTGTGERLIEIPTPIVGALPYLRFTPDNRRLIIGGFTSGEIAVWDLALRRESFQAFRHRSSIWDLDMSRDGRLLVGGSRNGECSLWNLWTSSATREPCPGTQTIEIIRCAADGSWLTTQHSATSSREPATRKWWNTRAGRAVPITLFHPAALGAIAIVQVNGDMSEVARYNSDGSLVATICRDGYARVWRAEDGTLLSPPIIHGDAVGLAVFSPDSTMLATGAANGEVCVWETKSGRPLKTLGSHPAFVTALIFSPDGRSLVSGADDGSMKAWETGSGRLIAATEGRWSTVRSLSVDPAGQRLAAGYRKGRAEILDLPSLRVIAALTENQGDVFHAQFSHDGKWVCTSSTKNAAQLWNGLTGEGPLARFPHGTGVWGAHFSPDDRLVVTASYDATARVWDRASGKPLTEPLPHANAFVKARFGPNDRSVITASSDGTAVVWDVLTGRALSEPFRHETGVQVACFSPDGKHILTAGRDGLARIQDWVGVEDKPPAWLPELAEAVGGYRLLENGVAEFVEDAATILVRLRETLARAVASDPLVKWGQWYLADRSTRPISPHSRIPIRDYTERLAQRDEMAVLEEALDLGSQNPLIYRKLAALVENAQPETARLYRRLVEDLGGIPLAPITTVAAAAPRVTPAPAPPNAGKIEDVDPLATEELLKREGQIVRVRGEILAYALSPYANRQFLNFAKNYRSGLSLMFNRDQNLSEFSPESLRAFVNKTVVVEGQIINYKGVPEIEIKSLAEIKIEERPEASAISPAAVAATPPVKTAPAPGTNAVEFLDPRDGEGLLKQEGQVVKIKGQIIKFSSATAGRVHYLNFSGNYRSSLSLVFFTTQNPSEFRPELVRNYVNKTVVVEGTIETYQGRPQIIMKSLAEIKEVTETGKPRP